MPFFCHKWPDIGEIESPTISTESRAKSRITQLLSHDDPIVFAQGIALDMYEHGFTSIYRNGRSLAGTGAVRTPAHMHAKTRTAVTAYGRPDTHTIGTEHWYCATGVATDSGVPLDRGSR
jgi:hypothetical protein